MFLLSLRNDCSAARRRDAQYAANCSSKRNFRNRNGMTIHVRNEIGLSDAFVAIRAPRATWRSSRNTSKATRQSASSASARAAATRATRYSPRRSSTTTCCETLSGTNDTQCACDALPGASARVMWSPTWRVGPSELRTNDVGQLQAEKSTHTTRMHAVLHQT